jgi:hypothetical protein
MFVCCECCVLSGRGFCDELATRPEESYRLWCVVVCDLENLKNEEAMTRIGSQRHSKKKILTHYSGPILPHAPFVLATVFVRILPVITLAGDERFGLVVDMS